MRVISGKYKGRQIKAKMPSGVRPTTDQLRESIFNILNNYILFEDKKVLDLFSGSGLVGFEFLSRGAAHCTFVDKSYQSISIIKRFAKEIKVDDEQVNIVKSDALKYIEYSDDKFNIIFSDAPYGLQVTQKIIDTVISNDILPIEGFLIIETTKEEPYEYEENFILVKEKLIGNTKLIILERK